MSQPLVTREFLAEAGFFSTPLARRLAAAPLGLVDVGARWGVDELFRPLAPLIDALAFEPDTEEATRITAREKDAGWAGIKILTKALGSKAERATLHLLARPNNSSLFPVVPSVAERYKLLGFELVREIPLDLVPLDALIFGGAGEGPHAGEVIKLDVQGAEAMVIAGAARTLSERTHCVICEVPFFAPYQGIELFSELELLLRARGLNFYGFIDFQHRSTKRLEKRTTLSRERMMQADAVFFRDPLAAEAAPANQRQVAVLFVVALVLGYFDFCLEMVDMLPQEERAALSDLVRASAAVDRAKDEAALETIMVARGNPTELHLAIGGLVDQRRDFTTFHDVTKPTKPA